MRSEAGQDRGQGQQGGGQRGQGGVRVGQVDQGHSLGPGDLSVPGHVQGEQPLENVLHIVRGNHQGEVPVKFGEQQEFPFLKQEK